MECLDSFRTENKLKSHEKVCKNKDFCGIVLRYKKDDILAFNQYIKSDKMPGIFMLALNLWLNKTDGCTNKPEKSSTTKIGRQSSCRYSMSTIWVVANLENKNTLYLGEDYYEKIWSIFKRTSKNYNWLWKETYVAVNKKELKSD